MTPDQLDLTENDFQLIIDGLDALPRVEDSSEMMTDLMITMLAPSKEEKEKAIADRERRKRNTSYEKKQLLEDIKILQGKLLLLKRYLQEQGALKEAKNIINNPGK